MHYADGKLAQLGDTVRVSINGKRTRARVVMLGDTYAHLDIDSQFVDWVNSNRLLDGSDIAIEFLDSNPLAHNDPRFAPVGNYMIIPLDDGVELLDNAHA